MKKKDWLSPESLASLFAKFNGSEAKVLGFLRENCPNVSNGDIQGIVEAYEATKEIENFHC